MSSKVTPIKQPEMTAEEWQTRVELAALYRIFVHYGWTDMIYTHITARVPAEPELYLINPYGLMFDEITASSLLKVDWEGNVISGDYPYNEAGHLIHTAVLKARPDVNFVLHSHSRAGMAVSAMPCGLLPLTQHAGLVMGILATHPYGAVTDEAEECDRLAADLGDKDLMIMHNHGLLACGRSAGEALVYHYYLEMACKAQVDIMQSGVEPLQITEPSLSILKEHVGLADSRWGEREWPALLRMIDRKDPSYKT